MHFLPTTRCALACRDGWSSCSKAKSRQRRHGTDSLPLCRRRREHRLFSFGTAAGEFALIVVGKAAVVLISAGVALFFATGFYAEWDTYLRFRYGGSFGMSDPLFGVDVGFYVFHLPFYVLLQSSLTLLTILTLGIVLSTYAFFGLQRPSGSGRIAVGGNATSHLAVLLFILRPKSS
jgi:uncharacterized membrane protein (UPF0182 family)